MFKIVDINILEGRWGWGEDGVACLAPISVKYSELIIQVRLRVIEPNC